MIREISLYSLNSKLYYIHPIEKMSLVIISLAGCSYTTNIYLILGNIALFIILNIIAKNPFKMVRKFLCITGAFFLFTVITLLWQKTPLDYILLLVCRVINGALTIAFLALTTPINHIVYLMGKNKWTRDVADIMKSMERFIIIIEDDFATTFKAIKSRAGFCGLKNSISDFGRTCGLVFKSLIFRWKEINLSLKNRCYIGKHNYYYKFKICKYRIILLVIYLLVVIKMSLFK